MPMGTAYRLTTKPNLAHCPYCGKRHRVFKRGVGYYMKCTLLSRKGRDGIYRVAGWVRPAPNIKRKRRK